MQNAVIGLAVTNDKIGMPVVCGIIVHVVNHGSSWKHTAEHPFGFSAMLHHPTTITR